MTVPTATATRRIDERTGTGSGRLRALVVELGAGVLKYRASSRDGRSVELRANTLGMILDGVDVRN